MLERRPLRTLWKYKDGRFRRRERHMSCILARGMAVFVAQRLILLGGMVGIFEDGRRSTGL